MDEETKQSLPYDGLVVDFIPESVNSFNTVLF